MNNLESGICIYSFMLILDEHGFSTLQSRERSWLALHRHICCITYIYIYTYQNYPKCRNIFSTLSTQLATYPPRDAWNPLAGPPSSERFRFFLPKRRRFRRARVTQQSSIYGPYIYIYIYIYTSFGGFTKPDSWSHWFQVRLSGFSGILPRFFEVFLVRGVFNPYLRLLHRVHLSLKELVRIQVFVHHGMVYWVL